jgi:hypothetical protein
MAESGDKYILSEFTVDDYEQFASWFDTPPELEDLPPIGLKSGDMKAVGFLYRTDSSFCIVAFWHANPANTKRETYLSLKRVVQGLCDTAKIIGKKNVFITTTNRGMIHLLKGLGFYNADGHLILRIV